MRYFATFWMMLLVLCVSSSGQSQAEMNAVAMADLEKADAKLNRIYKKIISEKAREKQFCNDLKEAQRAWIRFVEFHLKTVFPLKEGENPREVYGSIYPLEFAGEKTSLIEQRIKQLESLAAGSSQ